MYCRAIARSILSFVLSFTSALNENQCSYFFMKMLFSPLDAGMLFYSFCWFFTRRRKTHFETVRNHVWFRIRLITLSPVITINWFYYSEYITAFAYLHRVLSLSVGTERVGGLISKISRGAIKAAK